VTVASAAVARLTRGRSTVSSSRKTAIRVYETRNWASPGAGNDCASGSSVELTIEEPTAQKPSERIRTAITLRRSGQARAAQTSRPVKTTAMVAVIAATAASFALRP
jgi:hypothetical protein